MMTEKEIEELPDWLIIQHIKSHRDLLERYNFKPEESEILKDGTDMFKKELIKRRDILTAIIDEKYD